MQRGSPNPQSPTLPPIRYTVGVPSLPLADPQQPPPAARHEMYEQSKFLLLSQPPPLGTTTSLAINYCQLALDPLPHNTTASPHPPPTHIISPEEYGSTIPRSTSVVTATSSHAPTEDVGTQLVIPMADASTQILYRQDVEPEGPHELFGAMWVVADNRFVRRGRRHLDRPKYYVNAVLHVDEEGRAASYIPEDQRQQQQIPHPTTAMMIYSGDSNSSSNESSQIVARTIR